MPTIPELPEAMRHPPIPGALPNESHTGRVAVASDPDAVAGIHGTELPSQGTSRGRFTKKPVTIDAWRWNETMTMLRELEAAGMKWGRYDGHRDRPDECTGMTVHTLEGTSYAVQAGDWIIKGVKGEFYPCKPDVFAQTYDQAEGSVQGVDIVDRLNEGAPSVLAMRDGAAEIMRLRSELEGMRRQRADWKAAYEGEREKRATPLERGVVPMGALEEAIRYAENHIGALRRTAPGSGLIDCLDALMQHAKVAPERRATRAERDLDEILSFFTKHALGTLSKPSCLVCGRADTIQWPEPGPAIQHAELPGIVVCHPCRERAMQLSSLNYSKADAEAHGFDAETHEDIMRSGDEAMRRAVPAHITARTKEDAESEVQWIVNDNAELGVIVNGVAHFLYKGESLIYEEGTHDDGTPLLYRPVFKREFGECCHPVQCYEDGIIPRRYTKGEGWKPVGAFKAALPVEGACVPDATLIADSAALELIRSSTIEGPEWRDPMGENLQPELAYALARGLVEQRADGLLRFTDLALERGAAYAAAVMKAEAMETTP